MFKLINLAMKTNHLVQLTCLVHIEDKELSSDIIGN